MYININFLKNFMVPGQRIRPTKEEYYLDIAKAVASRGTCIRRKVGAVIVKDDALLSTGYVGAPRNVYKGQSDKPLISNCVDIEECLRMELGIPSGERYDVCKSVHGEENAITNAARIGSKILGATLFISDVKDLNTYSQGTHVYGPCTRCKRMIINSGIEKVFTRSGEGRIVALTIEDLINQLLDEEKELRKKYKK